MSKLTFQSKFSYLLYILFLFTAIKAGATVTVTSASGGTGLSADKSAGSSAASFTTLGNIVISSVSSSDFTINQSNVTFVLTAPANWEFNSGVGSVAIAGTTLTTASVNVTSSTITVTYSTNSTAASNNAITISGIQVRATSKAVIVSANIVRTAGTGTISGFTNTGNINCGSLSQIAGSFVKLQLLLPGEVTAPGTVSGKTGTPTARTAGAAFNVVVNAVDENWNKVTTVTDVVKITCTDANATLTANTALASGTKTFSVNFKTAGVHTVTATDITNGAITASTSPSVTANAGSFTKLQLLLPGETAVAGTSTGKTGTPSTITAGTPVTVTVNAVDASFNIVSTITDVVKITSNDGYATLPPNAALVSGTKTFNITLKTAGSKKTITASDVTNTSKLVGASPSFTVKAGAFTKLQIILPGETALAGSATGKTGTPKVQTAGVAIIKINVNAVDDNWNIVTTVTDVIKLTSTDTKATLPLNAALSAGVKNSFVVTLKSIGSYVITAEDVTNPAIPSDISTSVTVKAGSFIKMQILLPGETAAPGTTNGKTGTPNALVAGTPFNVTINAVDSAFNLVPGTDVINLTSSDANAILPPNAALVSGSQTFALTLKTAGTNVKITVVDVTNGARKYDVQPSVTVNAAAFSKLQLLVKGENAAPGTATGKTGNASPPARGVAFNVVVNAVDSYFNKISSATNSITITSSDGAATVPASAALVSGTKTFSVTLRTAGDQTITATGASFSTFAIVADGVISSAASDYFRSTVSGNWGNSETWESSANGLTNWHEATLTPTTAANSITILNNHIVTIESSVSGDQVTVAEGGQLIVNSGITFTVANGAGTDLEVFGILKNAGTITPTGTIVIKPIGTYQHTQTTTAGTVPTATWNSGSTCEFIGYTSATGNIGGMNQSFSNLVWNCTGQNVSTGISMAGTVTAENFSILSTGTGNVQLATTGGTITITGNYTQVGGTLIINNTSGTTNFNIAGNFTFSGGTLQKGSGTAKVNFNGSAFTQYFSKIGGTISGAVEFTINSGASVDFGTSVLDGTAAIFTLASGGTILTGNINGLAATGTASGTIQTLTRNYSTNGNYTYNGTDAQTIGTGLPITVNNLTIENSEGVLLPATTATYTIDGTLAINSGSLDLKTNILSAGSGFATSGSGKLITQSTSSTPLPSGKVWLIEVLYNGSSNQTITPGTYNNIYFSSEGIKTTAAGILNITGNWISETGKIDLTTNNTTITFNGTTQTLSDNSDGDNGLIFKNVTFGNSGIKTLSSGSFSIANNGLLSLSGTATLAANGNLYIQSDASGSGSIAPISTGTDITGNVNVQTFITGSGIDTYRGTRVFSSPINDAGLSKKTFEQLKDYTLITGPGNVANGFDLGGTVAPNSVTLQTYNESAYTSNIFIPVPTIYEPAIPGKGYFTFFRGNRSNPDSKLNAPFTAPEDVTVTYTGPINKNNVSLALTNSHNTTPVYAATDPYNGYNLVGNPYASTIDWNVVQANSSNLDSMVVIIKPGGGSATYIKGITNNGGSRYIQTGQAFYVRVNDNFNTGNIKFTESAKVFNVTVPRLLSAPVKNTLLKLSAVADKPSVKSVNSALIKVSLADELTTDETTIVFGNNYSKKSIDDAPYFSGSTVSLGSISSDGQKLAVNFTPELAAEDVIKLSVNVNESKVSKLLFTELYAKPGYSVILNDAYLNTSVNVNQNPTYEFYIDKGIAESFGNNRFTLSFKPESTLPVSLINFTAKKLNSGAQLSWTTAAESNIERFELEKATDNSNFNTIYKTSASTNLTNLKTYSYFDIFPASGLNYYRLKQIDKNGKFNYSSVETLDFVLTNNTLKLNVFPNPVVEELTITLPELKKKGLLVIYSLSGQILIQSTIPANQLTSKQNVSSLTAGTYIIEIRNTENNEVIGQTKFIRQ